MKQGKNTIEKIDKNKSQFFEKVNKLLARIRKKEKNQINKIRMKAGHQD